MKKRLLSTLLMLLIIIVVIAALTPIIISTRYEKKLEKSLPVWVARATDSLYLLTFEDISISTFAKNVTISGIRLTPDSAKLKDLKARKQLPPTVFSIAIGKVEVTTIRWADLFAEGEFNCKRFMVYHPQIVINKSDPNDTKPNDITRKKPKINRLKTDALQIIKPVITSINYTTSDSLSFFLTGGKIELSNWVFDPSLPEDTSSFFYAQKGTIEIDSAVLKKQNSLYTFKTGSIKFLSDGDVLTLKNIAVQPAMTKQEYYKRIGFRDEIFTMNFPTITVNGFNWHQISKGNFIVNSIIAESPVVDIYLNRLLPPEPAKIRQFPSQMLLGATLPISIDTVKIKNAQLRYTELSDKSKMERTLPFNATNVTIQHVTNIPNRILTNEHSIVNFQTNLFGGGVTGEMKFSLKDTLGSFSAMIHGAPLDGRKFNPLTKPIALMEIKSLNLEKATISMRFDGKRAACDFSLLYNGLDLKVLKANDDKIFNGKGLMSFLLNNALLYPSNPMPDSPPREVTALINRGANQTFFNFLWHSIRKGILLTAGRNAQVADMVATKP